LIDALREGAEPVPADERGSFTLDMEAAARKLSEHRYVDRAQYLPTLVEGLRALGSVEQSIETPQADVLLRASALRHADPALVVERMFEHAMLGVGHDRRSFGLGRFGVGVHMASGIEGVERVLVEVSDEATTRAMVFEEGRPIAVERRRGDDAAEPAEPGVRVFVDRSRWRDLASPILNASRHEVRALRQRAVWADPGSVLVDGLPIDSGRTRLAGERRGSELGVRARVGYDLHEDAEPGRLVFVSYGVEVERVERPEWDPGLRAVAYMERVRRDIGAEQLVRDEQIERTMVAVNRARDRALARLRKQLKRRRVPRRFDDDERRRVQRLLKRAGHRMSW
jgi:hypothetical protein